MLRFVEGNLFDADVEALVNTVNTVGVMGKGVALMVRERFPDCYRRYVKACRAGEVRLGTMFLTEPMPEGRPRWIIHFPTKQHWRNPSRLEWIESGLADLRRVIRERGIRSIALPPLGAGNGKLDWSDVRPLIERALGDLVDVDVQVFEPSSAYQNVAKIIGAERLTPARAMVAEMVRRYEVLGFECSILEVHKLAYFLTRVSTLLGVRDELRLRFVANRYGPYSDQLRHLLDRLDGSYLHCDKRLADAAPTDLLRFDYAHRDQLASFLAAPEHAACLEVIRHTDELIDGFQSPLGLEALGTVDWLLTRQSVTPSVPDVRAALEAWPTPGAGARKQRIFSDKLIQAALNRLVNLRGSIPASAA